MRFGPFWLGTVRPLDVFTVWSTQAWNTPELSGTDATAIAAPPPSAPAASRAAAFHWRMSRFPVRTERTYRDGGAKSIPVAAGSRPAGTLSAQASTACRRA